MECAKTFLTAEIQNPSCTPDLKELLEQTLRSLELGWWNELGQSLLKLVEREDAQNGLWQLYKNVIEKIASNLNPLTLVDISRWIANTSKDFSVAISFLKEIGMVVNSNIDASIWVKVLIGKIERTRKNVGGAKSIVDEIEIDLDKVTNLRVQFEVEKLKRRLTDGKHTLPYETQLGLKVKPHKWHPQV